jgi:hypothetical protein
MVGFLEGFREILDEGDVEVFELNRQTLVEFVFGLLRVED